MAPSNGNLAKRLCLLILRGDKQAFYIVDTTVESLVKLFVERIKILVTESL